VSEDSSALVILLLPLPKRIIQQTVTDIAVMGTHIRSAILSREQLRSIWILRKKFINASLIF
jgi:hypothetical protein